MKVIVVNGTNPNAEDIIAQVNKTGCKNLMFTGIGKAKARKLVDSMPPMDIEYGTFRRLADANEEYFYRIYNVVSTIGDFVKGKGKTAQNKAVEMNLEESKANAEKLCTALKNLSSDIAMYGYSLFKEVAKDCGATKTLRRGIHYYAYFGKLYVRFH